MNTEQIKNEILAKLEIEREVREQLGCQKSDQHVLTKLVIQTSPTEKYHLIFVP